MHAVHRWAPDMCFYCGLLDMKYAKDGRAVYLCTKRNREIGDSYVWRRKCARFVPAAAP